MPSPQTIEKCIKRCIDISTQLAALEDRPDVHPAVGSQLVHIVDQVDEMQRWLEGHTSE